MDTTSTHHDNHRVRLRAGPGDRVPALAGLAALSLAACGGGSEDAADYPDQEITFVVPFSAGGPTDTVTRLIAEPMGEELGQQIVVQNVEGAGGTVAAGQVADADADGYTVLVHHIGMSTAPALYPDLPYDPLEDFKTVGLVTDVPMTIVARKRLRARHARGPGRLRRGERRHGDPRQRGHRRRLPAVRPADRAGHRRRPHRGALRRHRPRDGRPGRRAGRLHVRPDDQHRRPDPVRRDQGLRRHDARAASRHYPTSRPRPRRVCPTSRWVSGTVSTCPRTRPTRSSSN